MGERTIHFDIWDTAGQERFKSLLPMYIRGATVAVVVFDVNDPLSLEDAVVHMKENDKIPIIALVANKADLLTDPAHDPIIAEAIKQSDIFNANFFLVSAKTGQGINKMFDALGTHPPLPLNFRVLGIIKLFAHLTNVLLIRQTAMAAAKYLAQAGDPILDAPAPSGTVNLDPDHHTNRKARSFNCWSFLSGWWGSSSALTPATETSDTSSSSM